MAVDESRRRTALEKWNGEVHELIGHEDDIAYDEELGERLFMSKQEAFNAGLFLGATDALKLGRRYSA